jgi:hypothetical protein
MTAESTVVLRVPFFLLVAMETIFMVVDGMASFLV